jgi:hypothetical protein
MKIYSRTRRTPNTHYINENAFPNDKSLLQAVEDVLSKPGEWINAGQFIKNLGKAAVDCGQVMPSDRDLLLAALRAIEKRTKCGSVYSYKGEQHLHNVSEDRLSTYKTVPAVVGHCYRRRNGSVTEPLKQFGSNFVSGIVVMNADGSHMNDRSECGFDLVEDLTCTYWGG